MPSHVVLFLTAVAIFSPAVCLLRALLARLATSSSSVVVGVGDLISSAPPLLSSTVLSIICLPLPNQASSPPWPCPTSPSPLPTHSPLSRHSPRTCEPPSLDASNGSCLASASLPSSFADALCLERRPSSALAPNSSCLRLAPLSRAPFALSTSLMHPPLSLAHALLRRPSCRACANAATRPPYPRALALPLPSAATAHSAHILVLVPCRAAGTLPRAPALALEPMMHDPRLCTFSSSRARSRRHPLHAGGARPKRVSETAANLTPSQPCAGRLLVNHATSSAPIHTSSIRSRDDEMSISVHALPQGGVPPPAIAQHEERACAQWPGRLQRSSSSDRRLVVWCVGEFCLRRQLHDTMTCDQRKTTIRGTRTPPTTTALGAPPPPMQRKPATDDRTRAPPVPP
ncbi:hypothetical protein DFH09DRAFT_1411961 [Mycena vulgaris]|nr:hypothetical protein DFH09DRAFT_1411961 [Mycena vulgaris]